MRIDHRSTLGLDGSEHLIGSAALLGGLFVLIFSLTGLSAQRAGAVRTTIAGRMSLVLTIVAAVVLFNEHLSKLALLGIILALVGLLLTSMTEDGKEGPRSWSLPFLIFLCSGAADIGVAVTHRFHITTTNASAFPTLCFGASAVVSAALLLLRNQMQALRNMRTWVGGAALGVVNYASLLFLIRALNTGGHPASVIFPLMNILAILIATAAGVLFFRERPSASQWCGISLCVVSLALITGASS